MGARARVPLMENATGIRARFYQCRLWPDGDPNHVLQRARPDQFQFDLLVLQWIRRTGLLSE